MSLIVPKVNPNMSTA